MLQNKFLFSYSKITLFTLAFLYFVMPIGLQYLVGEDFYIYSKYQFQISSDSLYFYILLVAVIYALVKSISKETYISKCPPSPAILKAIILLNFIYLVIIITRGISLRQQGLDRLELLSIISSQLIPGYGYLLLLACIAVIGLKNNKYLFVFVVLSFAVDLIYQGKIFATVALMLSMFFVDNMKVKFSYLRIFLFGIGGFAFLILIYFIRSTSDESGSSELANVYTSFSEFMGVQSTVGWAHEYALLRMPMALFNFDPVLQETYIASVGHGLAISPVAYFVGNFGEFYFLASIIYFVIVYLLFYYASKIIGRFSLFIFMNNFIHLLRHGPDIFLYKCVLQILFVIALILFLRTFKHKKQNNVEFGNEVANSIV